ncbi:hypothetical protein Bca52824_000881 [Brassica carinata]|uniref:ABC transporter domain-containing protein n=1 Tax=Brassica carinata TaxID=52824 RepID=A0A8X7WGD6_BRACI|nr:hypothetical protein Bca52824_000881 [Brassica carinata]
MADLAPASFLTQANALSRKNLAYQRRNLWSNVRLIVIPLYLCVLLVSIQALFDTQVNNSPDNRCGCQCIDEKCDKKICGLEYSSQKQAVFCAFPNPPPLPPLLQIPRPKSPSYSCTRLTGSCPVTILVTGNNLSLGAALSRNLLTTSFIVNSSVLWLRNPAITVLGTTSEPEFTNYLVPGIQSNLPIFNIQPQCTSRAKFSFSSGKSPQNFQKVEVRCVQGFSLWRNSSIDVSNEILKGYQKGNHENVIAAAYDLLDTDRNKFNVSIWYNSTSKTKLLDRRVKLVRVPRSVNLISNAYLQYLKGPGTKILFEFIKEMPKVETWLRVDIASSIGPIFFTWVILLLFPVILNTLVYEKQQRLRIIMKMHGLGDGPYWMISYAYFLAISTLYVICLMIFGSAIGLNFFKLNDYSIQFIFYFIYINLQISLAFLVSSAFSKVKTSSVAAYVYVFGSGLLGAFLFQFLMEDSSFPRRWIFVMEMYPGFSLYRGLYEFSEYALNRKDGMKWDDFSDSSMDEVFYIIIVEWFVSLIAAYYIDKISSSGKDHSFFLKNPFKFLARPSLQKQGSAVSVEMEKLDVVQERENVEQLMLEPTTRYAIVCDNLMKMYPGRDGNQPKMAVHGLYLAVPSGECFGMLGPNGAGKTSFINMMTGLVKPTSGTAFVRGLDICKDMDRAYTSMGVCPQHDLLWETLTGREHLLFYGRLKNLKGSDLNQAVEESLKSVNLSRGGVADKPAGKYSGGMKRRLSVAISLIGCPKVVYMDEPSTGLDPASRMNLWTVIKRAKTNTAIVLTTHSMEEAEFLCDRLGIFVDGRLQCIGNPKELKGRYGGSYVFTMTTSSEHEKDVEMLVKDVCPNAKKIYHIGGTQKFEIPKGEVRISEVFQAVEKAKSSFKVFAWGLADTTLEDVFIKVARTAQAFNKRNIWSNVRLIVIPLYLCVVLVGIQALFNTQFNNSVDNRCGCICIDEKNGDGKCERKSCGPEYSSPNQAFFCAFPNPPPLPPLLHIPSSVLDRNSCTRNTGSCHVTMLVTGNNHTLGATISRNLLPTYSTVNSSDDFLRNPAYNVLASSEILGTTSEASNTNYLDPGIHSDLPIFNIQARCTLNTTLSSFLFQQSPTEFRKAEERCVQGLNLWRNNSMEINKEIFKGYQQENHEESIDEIVAAYDLLDTNGNMFSVTIWYNSTSKFKIQDRRVQLVQVPRSVNLVSNAYLEFLQGPGTKMLFDFVKEMPKQETRLQLDVASLIGPIFFTWAILLLFPVILTSLVYEKQQRLRIIMKMHGLGNGPYWLISYVYYLIISTFYIISLMIFGSAIGLKFFLFNDYSFQFIFYFLYINLQISIAFLFSSAFSKVETASVVSYMYIFGSGLLGTFLFQFLIEDVSFPRRWIFVMELYPGFSLYRGLYEFSIYAYQKNVTGRDGMKWKYFTNSGMDEVFYIIIVEWFVALIATYYIDQGSLSLNDSFSFLRIFFKRSLSPQKPRLSMQSSSVTVEMEKLDVTQERDKVEKLMLEPSRSHAIVCDNLKKVYPGRDGNPPKMAVRGLSLAVASKECFGMLGPNGAGKTSFINTMTGLVKPTSGAAFVQGLDICKDMDKVYTSMGVCPQHDLLWETLTGREHLLFYGRLKNLKGSELNQVVEESLKSVNLFNGGVADKPAGKYSGGMKRRLSVAISLIGSPKVVYMDEPSTGLDPASRMNLWTAIKRAKRHTAIILTTHSMEEAEFLCDRLGIFVDGRLQCIGNPKELKARYGGSYLFTMTTSSEHEQDVEMLVQDLSPNAKKIYHIAGTQKFEIPKEEVRISKVFQAVEKAKTSFTVFAWGLEDTTLEDVFIKVARGAQDFNVLS